MRKITLAVTILVCMLLIPLPLYARGGHGGGHGGFGGHSGGHSGFRHGGFGGHRFGGHSGFGHGGFHAGHLGHGHFGHGHFGHFGRGHHNGHFFPSFFLGGGFGALALSPFVIYPYYTYPYSYYNYPYTSSLTAAQSYGDLEIQVAPEDVEIYVDGRFIGLARDFKEPAMVSVLSGNHVVEFRYNGSSSTTNVYVVPGSTSVVSGEFKPNPQYPQESPQGFSPPPAYRYFPTVYHQESTGLLKLDAEPKKASIYIDDKLLAPVERLDRGVIGLPYGSHSVTIAMPGYVSYSGKVYITEDATNELKVRLERQQIRQ